MTSDFPRRKPPAHPALEPLMDSSLRLLRQPDEPRLCGAIVNEAFAKKFASVLRTPEDRDAVLSLFPDDHPARRWLTGH